MLVGKFNDIDDRESAKKGKGFLQQLPPEENGPISADVLIKLPHCIYSF